jgi:hypothetical protein
MRDKLPQADRADDSAVHAARVSSRGAIIAAVLSALAVVAGASITAYFQGHKQGTEDATPPTVTVVRTVTAAGQVATDTTTSDGTATISAVPAQIRLTDGTGVDLDVSDPHPVETAGPNGPIDLFYQAHYLRADDTALFEYSGTEAEAAAACPRIVATGQNALSSASPDPGFRFCFRTSKGRIGWLNCNDFNDSGDPAAEYVVFNYRLFS